MKKSLVFVCLLIAAVAQAADVPEMPTANRGVLPPVVVNCSNGESIQAAVDASRAPAEIVISGICTENVLIRDKDVSLRGAQKASLDGIRSTIASTPALTVRGSVIATINDLSFSNSAGTGAAIRGGANITINNCLFERDRIGLRVDSGSFVIGNNLVFTANSNSNANASDAQFFCITCDVNGGGPAEVATRGAIMSMLDSAITGTFGLVVIDRGSFADIDCLTLDTTHPCSLNVSQFAALGLSGGTAVLTQAGSFTGQLIADDRGTVRVDGSQQAATTVDGQPNIVDGLGELVVAPIVDAPVPAQSVVRSTDAFHFGRVLLTGDSVLKGAIRCNSAADAFLDATVIRSGTVTGCEHGPISPR